MSAIVLPYTVVLSGEGAQSVITNRDARVVIVLKGYVGSTTAVDHKIIEVVEGVLKLILYILSVEHKYFIRVYLSSKYIVTNFNDYRGHPYN